MEETAAKHRTLKGLMALSPIVLFVVVYLVSALICKDFYRVPVSASFLIAAVYAVLITPGKIQDRIASFSQGAADGNVLMMVWIFILAGAFAGTAKDMGAVESTVNFTLSILPDRLVYAGLFIASCFISMSIGTSVGTIVALVPIAAGIASHSGGDAAFLTGIVAGGAFFGDNLSFISDTTIAATRTQDCRMRDKFRANLRIVLPAAILMTVVYVLMGMRTQAAADAAGYSLLSMIPYILIILLAISGVNVMLTLAVGMAANAVIGLSAGAFDWVGFLVSIGHGIQGMGDLIIVTMLAAGLLALIRRNGGMDFILSLTSRHIHGRRGAEFSIAALVSLANVCTANNTIAIITTGGMAKDISRRFGLEPKRVASLLDTFSCMVQGLLPYGAQMLMAASLASLSPVAVISKLYYPMIMGVFAILSIILPSRRKEGRSRAWKA